MTEKKECQLQHLFIWLLLAGMKLPFWFNQYTCFGWPLIHMLLEEFHTGTDLGQYHVHNSAIHGIYLPRWLKKKKKIERDYGCVSINSLLCFTRGKLWYSSSDRTKLWHQDTWKYPCKCPVPGQILCGSNSRPSRKWQPQNKRYYGYTDADVDIG